MLVYLLLPATFGPAMALPLVDQYSAISWISETLKLFQQELINFLNLYRSPSITQTVVSCIVLIFISALCSLTLPSVILEKATPAEAFKIRLSLFVYGLVSPDYLVMEKWAAGIGVVSYAKVYNKAFQEDDPKKRWTPAHGAFMLKGGFVLWEDDKPAKTLGLLELINMIKAGEVDPPTITKKEIYARTKRVYGQHLPFLAQMPIIWFTSKFREVAPILVSFVATHALINWFAITLCSNAITGVIEPVVVMRKTREKSRILASGDSTSEKARLVSDVPGELVNLEDEMAEMVPCSVDPVEVEEMQSKEKPTIFRSLEYYLITFIGNLYGLCTLLIVAITLPLRAQWKVISHPNGHLRNFVTVLHYIERMLVTVIYWGLLLFFVSDLTFPSNTEQTIWHTSCLFLLLQPVILLLLPHRLRQRIPAATRKVFFLFYRFVYLVARLSIFFLAFYSLRDAI